MGTAATPSASGSAPPSWEALPDSARRIYLALADGDEDQARQLLKADRQAAATRRVRSRSRRRRADPRSSATRRDRQASRPAPEADPGHVRDRETNSRQAETKGKTRAKTKAKTATGMGTGRGTAGGGSATRATTSRRRCAPRRPGSGAWPEAELRSVSLAHTDLAVRHRTCHHHRA